jgi:hypothetical protein
MRHYAVFAAGLVICCSFPAQAVERVKIGAYVMRLGDLNSATNSFATVVEVWTVSHVASTRDPVELHPIQTLRLGDTLVTPSPKINEQMKDGLVWGSLEFDATVKQKLDVRHFPFDRQTLRIRIVETEWSAKYLIYDADAAETRIDPRVDIPGWEITGCRIETLLVPYPTRFGNPAAASSSSTWSEAWVLIDVRRNGIGVFAKLVLVAYISFALMMLSFMMDRSVFSSRVSILVGCLFATVVNMGAAEAVLGRTDNFTLVDQIHLLVAFFILVSAITGLVTRRMEVARARTIDHWTAFTTLTLFLVANAVLIGTALR